MSNTYENFEKLYGPVELLKAVTSVINEILVDSKLTSVEDLKSRLQTRLITHEEEIKNEPVHTVGRFLFSDNICCYCDYFPCSQTKRNKCSTKYKQFSGRRLMSPK